eukprot:3462585-Prorocentrum_lima.AAC.1
MTSSLVGSEMCIRDSHKSVRPALNLTELSALELEASKAMICHKHPDAVSYTHLTLPTICSV